jgi:hypothetical protein
MLREQKFGQAREIDFERLLVEGYAGKAEKVVLEIVQVPGDGLAVEAGTRIANFVIQIASRLDLEARQDGDNFAIRFNDLGRDFVSGTIGAEEFKESGVAQIFFEIGPVAQVLGIDLGYRQPVTAEMAGKLEKSNILFAHGIENSDGGVPRAGEADNDAPGTAELALERHNALRRRLEVLLEKASENVHERLLGLAHAASTTIVTQGKRTQGGQDAEALSRLHAPYRDCRIE